MFHYKCMEWKLDVLIDKKTFCPYMDLLYAFDCEDLISQTLVLQLCYCSFHSQLTTQNVFYLHVSATPFSLVLSVLVPIPLYTSSSVSSWSDRWLLGFVC